MPPRSMGAVQDAYRPPPVVVMSTLRGSVGGVGAEVETATAVDSGLTRPAAFTAATDAWKPPTEFVSPYTVVEVPTLASTLALTTLLISTLYDCSATPPESLGAVHASDMLPPVLPVCVTGNGCDGALVLPVKNVNGAVSGPYPAGSPVTGSVLDTATTAEYLCTKRIVSATEVSEGRTQVHAAL